MVLLMAGCIVLDVAVLVSGYRHGVLAVVIVPCVLSIVACSTALVARAAGVI